MLPLKERTFQLETRLAFFGVTRSRMLKTLPSDKIPPGGYSTEDLPGNREIEAQTLQLFRKEFLPECISIMSEFRSRGFDVTKLRQQMTDVAGEGFEFQWIAGELKLLADQLDPSERAPSSVAAANIQPTLSIVFPDTEKIIGGNMIGPKMRVEVKFANIPLEQHIWLVVKTPEGGYLPHGRCNPADPLGPSSGPSLIERAAPTDHWETPDGQELHFGAISPHPYTIYAIAVLDHENSNLVNAVRQKCAAGFQGFGMVGQPKAITTTTRDVFRRF